MKAQEVNADHPTARAALGTFYAERGRVADAEREFAYDRSSSIGHLDAALDAAPGAGFVVIDMARDWATIWPAGTR